MKNILLLIAITLLTPLALVAQNQDTGQYEFVTVTVEYFKPKVVYVSSSEGLYEEVQVSAKGRWDYSGVLAVVKEKQDAGYELFSNNFSTYGGSIANSVNYFLLRRKKN